MYIKIKNIKKIILIAACIVFAGVNYLNFVKADTAKDSCSKTIDADCDGLTNDEENAYGTNLNDDDTDGDGYSDGVEVKSGYDPKIPAPGDRLVSNVGVESNNITNGSNVSLTENLADKFKTYVSEKGDTPITNTEISKFISENLSSLSDQNIDTDLLPEVDTSKNIILDQSYADLTTDVKKEKITEDAAKYFSSLVYIAISNSPQPITTADELGKFNDDFSEKVATLASTNTDYEYFSDLGKRLELIVEQMQSMQVPETILPLHSKLMNIIIAFVQLRDINVSDSDPISKMILLTKVQRLTDIATSFIGNDVVNYLKEL